MTLWILCTLLCMHLGCVVARRCLGGGAGLGERLALAASAALGAYLLVPLWVGIVTGSISPWARLVALLGLVAVVTAGGGVAGAWQPRVLGAGVREGWARVVAWGWGARLAWALVLLWWAATALPGWFLPPRAWDATYYHFHQPAAMLSQGRFTLDTLDAGATGHANYYAEANSNIKAMHVVQSVQARGTWHGAGLIQSAYALLFALMVNAMGARLGLVPAARAVAALFFLSMPEAMLQSTEFYADVMAAGAMAALLWAVQGYATGGQPARWLVPLGLGFAHLTGAKTSLLVPGALLGALCMGLAWWRGAPGGRAKAGALMTCAGAAGVALGAGPWLGRMWWLHGNPLFPYEVKIASEVVFAGLTPPGINTEMLFYLTGHSPATAAWRALVEGAGITHLANRFGGFGPNLLVLGLPALCGVLFWTVRGREKHWAFLLTLGLICWMGVQESWWPRFALPLMLFPALALGWFCTHAQQPLRLLALVLLGSCLAWNGVRVAPAVLFMPSAPMVAAHPFITGDTDPIALRQMPGLYSVRSHAREHLTRSSARVAYRSNVRHTDSILEPLMFVPGRRDIVIPVPDRAELAGDGEWLESLRRAQATHVLVPQDAEEARIMQSMPEQFELLMADRRWPAEHRWGPEEHEPETLWRVLAAEVPR